MSFLDIDFNDTFEPKAVPPGEYNLRVLRAEIKTSKNTGGDYLNLQMEIVNEPEADNIYHIMMLPTSNDDIKKANKRKLALLAFFKAFGVDATSGMNVDILEGQTGWAILDIEDDPEFGQRNRVKKFVTGA